MYAQHVHRYRRHASAKVRNAAVLSSKPQYIAAYTSLSAGVLTLPAYNGYMSHIQYTFF